jgi:7-cyano-7-deazaguanine synthase in queuosine biosynthesis
MTQHEGSLVLLSGGQDSAVCLAWALDRFELVETLGFDYGERHRVQLECRGSSDESTCVICDSRTYCPDYQAIATHIR